METEPRDLFPKIRRPSTDVEPEDSSISTDEIRQKLSGLSPAEWEHHGSDKFFFTRLLQEGVDDSESLSDFDRYDKLVRRELALEQKAQKVIDELQTNDLMVIGSLNGFDAGVEQARKSSKYDTLLPKLKRPQKVRHREVNLARETSRESNKTEIVDLSEGDLINSRSMFSDFQHNPDKPHAYHLQRKLNKPQIQMIALGGTLGVGLFLSSGKAFSISGPLGCFLGFMISGSIVLATMLSFGEMSTLIPTTSSISGLASRFVEDAFGFALGWCYWLSFAIAMPGEVCAATIMLSFFQGLDIPGPQTAGFVALFLVVILAVNLFDVRIYGNVEYVVSLTKVLLSIALIITMIVVNVKEGYGFIYWDSSKSPDWATYGPFRPTFDLNDVGNGARDGIGGALGNLLGVLSSILISSYAYTGSEIGFVASMECKNPRKTLPSVTKRVFGRVVILYLLSIFLVGLNIYSGDPRLLRYYDPKDPTALSAEVQSHFEQRCNSVEISGVTNGSQSPWVIALQSAGYCAYSRVANGIFVVFGVSAGSSHLYVSSRTLYSMATQRKAFKVFSKCSRQGVPYYAVLFSGAFGLLAFLSCNNTSLSVFQDFANISAATAMLMWSGMCLSFLRFYYGLKLRPDIIARNDPSYPYRSPLQPFLAIYGLFGSMLIVIFMGFVVFLNGFWDTKTFFVSYGALMLFTVCYLGYKIFGNSKVHRLDQLDLDSGRREMDRIIWNEEKTYTNGMGEVLRSCVSWLA